MATTDVAATLVDANVLIDLLERDPQWAARSRDALRDAARTGLVGINQLIYAEVVGTARRPAAIDELIDRFGLVRMNLPWEAAQPAARAFVSYRRAGGARRSPPPDFYIGAHAEVSGLRLLTRDEQRYRRYFPDVELLVP